MPFRFFSLIVLVVFASCKTSVQDTLYKIPRDEIVLLVKHNKLNYPKAKFLNQDGTELSDARRKRLNRGELGKDYYMDKEGVIREVRVRHIELADKMIEIQKRELSSKPLSKIKLLDIDCQKLDSIYTSVEQSTIESRKAIESRLNPRARNNFYNYSSLREEADSINQQITVSAISKCGYTDEHLSIIWGVLESSPIPLVAYYYTDFKTFSNDGKLDRSRIATMEDRLLRRHRYPQIYGTIVHANKLYDLEDPEYVNDRRERMGMEPIEEYLTAWDLDFKEEVERMKNSSSK